MFDDLVVLPLLVLNRPWVLLLSGVVRRVLTKPTGGLSWSRSVSRLVRTLGVENAEEKELRKGSLVDCVHRLNSTIVLDILPIDKL